jgi:hypothetical protein
VAHVCPQRKLLPGIKILILPVNNRDVLSKYFGMVRMIGLIVFMPESAIVSRVDRKATWQLNKKVKGG